MAEKQTTRSKWALVEIIGKPYAMNVLEALSEKPARFVDLKKACSHDSTLTKRLRELTDAGLVETTSVVENKRPFICYQLTRHGDYLFKTIDNLFLVVKPKNV